MNKKNILIIAGSVALFIAILLGANYIVGKNLLPPPRSNGTTNNQQLYPTAQDFTLTDLSGNKVSLSDYRGKYVLVNFWTTWCPPCRAEMPDIQRFSENNKDLEILAVNIQEDSNKVKQFIQEQKFTFPVLLDTSGQVANIYRVSSIPASFFVNKDGQIVNKHIGSMTYDDLENYFKEMKGN